MSSVVKAKLLAFSSKSNENCKREELELASGLGVTGQTSSDEKREEFLRESIKKSRHIESEALKRADEIVENAIKASEGIARNAELKGYDDGYLRGLVDGANQAYQAAEEGLEEIRTLLTLIRDERYRTVKEEESHLMEISFEIAKKIMRHTVRIEENILEKMLEEVILENDGKIKISISEYQKTLDIRVDRGLAKKIKEFSKDTKIIFVKEEDSIIVETVNGAIDMGIPVQIAQLEKAVENKA